MTQIIQVIVGTQFGSEAKGHVTAQLVKKAVENQDNSELNTVKEVINIRVAGPNAGHTVYDTDGNKFAFRQVPVGSVVDDSVTCYIAPGSEIDLEVLLAEIDLLQDKGHNPTIFVSGEATLITDEDKNAEREAMLSAKIGSTGKGIGAARAARIMRTAKRVVDSEEAVLELLKRKVELREPHELYADDDFALPNKEQYLLVEGTQGYGLGLHAGFYPQVTSSDCRAIDFLSMAGISPWRENADITVWVVARPYPIRVAGNSGPLNEETTWEELGLEPEYTTVTNKERRVGLWDGELVAKAVQANGGKANTKLAFTMADQVLPLLKNQTKIEDTETEMMLNSWILKIETEANTTVGLVTTSPTTCMWI